MAASIHHLDSTSAKPELGEPGKMYFYCAKYCPFCQRVALVLGHHGIDNERIYINLEDKPTWYTEKIPGGKVPLMEQDGEKLQDSEFICRFLDQLHPTRSLEEKVTSESAKVAEEFFKTSFKPMHLIMFESAPHTDDDKVNLLASLDILEAHLSKQKGNFMTGEEVSLSDFMIYPVLERIPVALEMAEMGRDSFGENRRNLVAWRDAMLALPEVTKESIPFEQHLAFAKTKKAGKGDWNI